MKREYIDENGEVKTGVFLRTPFNYDMNEVSDETGLKCEDISLTVQSEKDDADINVLVERFGLTGTMPVLQRIPLNADFQPAITYHEAMEQIRAADEIFASLPAQTRAEFDNDPGKFLDFTSNEKNRDKMKEMGLLKEEPPTPQPVAVRVISDPPAAS